MFLRWLFTYVKTECDWKLDSQLSQRESLSRPANQEQQLLWMATCFATKLCCAGLQHKYEFSLHISDTNVVEKDAISRTKQQLSCLPKDVDFLFRQYTKLKVLQAQTCGVFVSDVYVFGSGRRRHMKSCLWISSPPPPPLCATCVDRTWDINQELVRHTWV